MLVSVSYIHFINRRRTLFEIHKKQDRANDAEIQQRIEYDIMRMRGGMPAEIGINTRIRTAALPKKGILQYRFYGGFPYR